MSTLPVVSIITGNSNSGKYCIQEIYEKYPNKVKLRAAFRSEEKAKPFREKYPQLEVLVDVDASKHDTLKKLFKDSHYALIVTPHDYTRGFSDDAQLTANMINSAVENGVKYIVLVASFTVNNMEKMSYIGSRFKPSEDLLVKLGNEKNIKWTVLRGGFFMENLLQSVEKAKESLEFKFANLIVPMVDTKDIGKSAAACLTSSNIDQHDKKCYEMNGPSYVSSKEVAETLSKVLKKEIKYEEITKEMIEKTMPPPMAQIFGYMAEQGKNAAPFKDDVRNLTGQNGTLEQFFKDHLKE